VVLEAEDLHGAAAPLKRSATAHGDFHNVVDPERVKADNLGA
jgi:hypothetical protein